MDSSASPNPPDPDPNSSATPGEDPARDERERLLEGVVRVAAEKGYEATTVADITEFAGLPREAFERHFADKHSCFLEAYDAVMEILFTRVATAVEDSAGESWPDQVAAGLRALVELLAEESDVARMAMVEVAASGELARERYRAALSRFGPFLEPGREYSGQGDELPADTASFAIGGAASMIFDEIRAGRGPELPELLPDLVFTVLMPYLGAAAASQETRRLTGTA